MTPRKRAPDASATLGDLVYADQSATIPEAQWAGLVSAIATGDQHAMRALYDRTHRLVFTLAVRICSSHEAAEEVTLDVFHEVWRRAGEYEAANGSVVGWLMILARSRALDRVRFEHRKKRRAPGDPDAHADLPAEDVAGADALDAEEERRALIQALGALTADERVAIETAFFSELSYAETAAQLDEPVGTIKTRVRSALAKLRKTLSREGGGE